VLAKLDMCCRWRQVQLMNTMQHVDMRGKVRHCLTADALRYLSWQPLPSELLTKLCTEKVCRLSFRLTQR
jgi:hypothetical protein